MNCVACEAESAGYLIYVERPRLVSEEPPLVKTTYATSAHACQKCVATYGECGDPEEKGQLSCWGAPSDGDVTQCVLDFPPEVRTAIALMEAP